jgi:nanoRNase/pAp phosphatase (c-di-AMP/oligoRNAs hydrolase)
MSGADLNVLLKAVKQAGQVIYLPHNDPDPDAIASAVALRHLVVETTGVIGPVMYRGIIGRAENRALVRYLSRPLTLLGDNGCTDTPVILIDTQPGAGNNPWDPTNILLGVIDHHPHLPESQVAIYQDVRPVMGATATIIYEYFQLTELSLSKPLSTALFYGLKTDTNGLSRGVTEADAAAYYALQKDVDTEALADLERAQVPPSYFRVFAHALVSTRLYGTLAVTDIGPMDYPDMAAEMADLLIRLENVLWVVCAGVYKNKMFIAVRAPEGDADAGQLVQTMVQGDGTSGGHDTMAGGQIDLAGRSADTLMQTLLDRLRTVLNIDPDVGYSSLV